MARQRCGKDVNNENLYREEIVLKFCKYKNIRRKCKQMVDLYSSLSFKIFNIKIVFIYDHFQILPA